MATLWEQFQRWNRALLRPRTTLSKADRLTCWWAKWMKLKTDMPKLRLHGSDYADFAERMSQLESAITLAEIRRLTSKQTRPIDRELGRLRRYADRCLPRMGDV